MPSCKNLLLALNLRNRRRKSKSKRQKLTHNERKSLLPESAPIEEEEEEEEEDVLLAEEGKKTEDGSNVEREERKSFLEILIMLVGNIPRER
uniref:Uncharacterized protein n=1 Tax=Noccaea caerulescens TaxID=107243 RepID=A0A1J3EXQ8_NOCCA